EIVVDRMGRTNTYVYDPRGNVTAMTNALGGVTTNAYDLNNNKLCEVLFNNGAPYATNSFGYSTNGLLLASTNALGFTNGFSYDSFGHLTSTVNARGFSSSSFYDPLTGLLVGTSDPMQHTTTNFYSNGLLIGSQDTIGILT